MVEAYTACAAFYLQSHPLGPHRRHDTFAGDPFHVIQEGGGTTGTEQKVCLRKATYFQGNTTSVQANERIITFTHSNIVLIIVLILQTAGNWKSLFPTLFI